jgi:hypothetical protein
MDHKEIECGQGYGPVASCCERDYKPCDPKNEKFLLASQESSSMEEDISLCLLSSD